MMRVVVMVVWMYIMEERNLYYVKIEEGGLNLFSFLFFLFLFFFYFYFSIFYS